MSYYANPEDLKNYGASYPNELGSDIQRLLMKYELILKELEKAIRNQKKLAEEIHDAITPAVNKLGTYSSGEGTMPTLLTEKRQKAWKKRDSMQKELDERIACLRAIKQKAENDLDILAKARAREKSENKKIPLSEIGF